MLRFIVKLIRLLSKSESLPNWIATLSAVISWQTQLITAQKTLRISLLRLTSRLSLEFTFSMSSCSHFLDNILQLTEDGKRKKKKSGNVARWKWSIIKVILMRYRFSKRWEKRALRKYYHEKAISSSCTFGYVIKRKYLPVKIRRKIHVALSVKRITASQIADTASESSVLMTAGVTSNSRGGGSL